MSDMSLTRREFLQFMGAGAAYVAVSPYAGLAQAAVPLSFTPVRLPHPLEIYTTNGSFLATGLNGVGVASAASPAAELTTYAVIDDVVVPPEFERYVLLAWGDRPFPNPSDYVGYNHDFTAYIPLVGTSDGIFWVNHEYTSYPFHEAAPGTSAGGGNPNFGGGNRSFETVIGGGNVLPTLAPGANPATNLLLVGEQMYNVGGSIVRIRRTSRNGRFAPVSGDSRNRRIHGLSGVALNSGPRTGTYPSSWGTLSHQLGDSNFLVGTGPAATDVFTGVNADGLGNQIIGTFANCSGGVTPWGTILSAEENFQGAGGFSGTSTSYPFYNGVTEGVTATGTQSTGVSSGDAGYTANTAGALFGLVGEKYGYMVEIDPRQPATTQAGRGKKHTALGRFRHENIAIRCEAGQPLIAYMGDDRRGGHTWKFVSSGTVTSVTDTNNSALFESGTLYVARFNADGSSDAGGTYLNGTGQWIPIALTTPCNPFDPSVLASVQVVNTPGSTEANGRINLPARANIAGSGATVTGGFFGLTTTNKSTINPNTGQSYFNDYRQFPGGATKTLGDFYTTLGAALVDAFGAGGLVGGTPCARPEDIEIHPRTKDVYIAMTDGRPGSDGYPDSRIFVVAKYNASIDTQQQSGGLYRISEDSANGAGTTFTWSRYLQGGEEGTSNGAGFANIDNLIFDSKMNLWIVTDMTTGLHNAVRDGPTPAQLPVTHSNVGGSANENLVGTYGNNWLFHVPTEGPSAGKVVPFAVGPVRCEMTGPTFVGDTLVISVQHPSEDSPTGGAVTNFASTIEMLKLDGSGVYTQVRQVPTGSNWPSNIQGSPTGYPKPCTIGIRRKNGGSFI